ncbi:peptide ABC transporter substrate-binding protein [Clostridium arbusti]|uniref:peptide ABC transporter substrate-binding protein n=1 Tax=Clostridium arbusti TaxID=1137848 RepID=UPI00028A282A|nr:peptide ABC transporter substrate-binding protein [Clostridium arbusti]
MLKSKKSRLCALVMSAVIVGTLLGGCGSKSSTTKSEQKITFNLNADPKTIDPALNSSVEGATVIANAFEGLLDVDSKNQPIAGVASKWDITDGGKHYTFHLRKEAKWSDGKPVKAQDFEYAWKRALAPETASDYAYQLYYLKGGEAYNQGKASVDQVGVKATDDYTLDVDLENATPYFLGLMSFPTYMPVRKDIVDAHPKDWAIKGATYVSNGAFKLQDWKPKDSLNFVKNTNYWNAKNIKLDTLKYTVLDQETSYLSAFQSSQIDMIYAPPAEQIPTLLKNGTAKTYANLGTYYYSFNLAPDAAKINPDAAKVMQNPKVRQAISLAIDRTKLVKDVTKGGQNPATSFVPKGITIDGKDFKDKEYYKPTADVAQAKQLLAEAGYPDGKGLPSLEVIYNNGQGHQSIAQAVQDMLKKNLNINITLRSVERTVQLNDTTKHQYIMARNGWSADYADPMTFLDMWVTGAGNNVAGYSNPDYDKLIDAAKGETDVAKRTTEMHEAEDILMKDMPVIPLYEYNYVVCEKNYVKGVNVSPLGFFYFQNAYVQK